MSDHANGGGTPGITGEGAKQSISEEKLRALIVKKIRSVYIPSSVYRLQLNHKLTFKQAEAVVPYLKELGIDAVYCSPFFQATPGSMHGYNITDPGKINPEIGSHEDFISFSNTLLANGMGLIADVVPNHMGITGNTNRWWQDTLENGQSSLYAQYFDIDWKPVTRGLAGKVLLPVLGDFYGKELESGRIGLLYEKGGFFACYFNHRFPIDPRTYPLILEDSGLGLCKSMGEKNPDYLELLSIITALGNLPLNTETDRQRMVERRREKEIAKKRLDALRGRSAEIREFTGKRIEAFNGIAGDASSFDLLHGLLSLQPYRLAYWLVAFQEINYRRFFDINELAAIRIEDEHVFFRYHELLFSLVRDGRITGLRVDHPDGLYDPPVYFRRLQREYLLDCAKKERRENGGEEPGAVDEDSVRMSLDKLLASEFSASPSLYVVAEKILAREESLPENWIVHGTVGYDYMNALNGLFVERKNEKAFAALYDGFIGHVIDFETLVYNKKKLFGLIPMASEINALGHRLDLISDTNRNFRDFTMNDLTVALRETIAGFPVYRTYVSPDNPGISEIDERNIKTAIDRARGHTPALNPAVYDFLERVLLLRLDVEPGSEEMKLYKDFLMRFQQLTGPMMAKGLEDTSFYVYNRLVSLNEVGGDPFYFGYTVDDFHAHNAKTASRWPASMLATSTHDTKRSEDARMRVNALSEMPEEWSEKIGEWSSLNAGAKTDIGGVAEPRPNTEYLIYQTLLASWPDEMPEGAASEEYVKRICGYVIKSVREAKIYTNWVKPETEYENAVLRFVKSILDPAVSRQFLSSFTRFEKRISHLGKLGSISASVLKIASPGVVDVYQGNESWTYNLVDPDNRREVDFDALSRALYSLKAGAAGGELFSQAGLSRLKLFYTSRGLAFRRGRKELFAGGEYIPLKVTGVAEGNVVAFMRRRGKEIAVAAVIRFFSGFPEGSRFAPGEEALGDTLIECPEDTVFENTLTDVFTGTVVKPVVSEGLTALRADDVFSISCACLLSRDAES